MGEGPAAQGEIFWAAPSEFQRTTLLFGALKFARLSLHVTTRREAFGSGQTDCTLGS
jgi:hypothetical protein